MTALDLFAQTLAWLRQEYARFRFFTERDVVWTVQTHLIEAVVRAGVPLRVFSDYGIVRGERRSLSADIALVGPDGQVELTVEFKYEPSHARGDIPGSKFPVVFWGSDGVGKDVERVRAWVAEGRARVGVAVFIDEGGQFRHREPHAGSRWIDWDKHPEYGQTSVLWTEAK